MIFAICSGVSHHRQSILSISDNSWAAVLGGIGSFPATVRPGGTRCAQCTGIQPQLQPGNGVRMVGHGQVSSCGSGIEGNGGTTVSNIGEVLIPGDDSLSLGYAE